MDTVDKNQSIRYGSYANLPLRLELASRLLSGMISNGGTSLIVTASKAQDALMLADLLIKLHNETKDETNR